MSEIVTALEVRIDSYRQLSCKLKEAESDRVSY